MCFGGVNEAFKLYIVTENKQKKQIPEQQMTLILYKQ